MMATSCKLLSLLVLETILQLLPIFAAAKSRGLSIELIHRDSPESPFYTGNSNITSSQRIRHQFQSASTYAARLLTVTSMSSSGIKTDDSKKLMTRPNFERQHVMYMLEVGIGAISKPFTSGRSPYRYLLHLDLSADMVWIQCEECKKMGKGACFRQMEPLFPANRSHTYNALPCDMHPLCTPGKCIAETCSYSTWFGDVGRSEGYLATESFTFNKKAFLFGKRSKTTHDIVFGCGIKNTGFGKSPITGIVAGQLGMGAGKLSFVMQKESLTQGRFSYCLPPWKKSRSSPTLLLRFGSDIPKNGNMEETPMSTNPGYPSYLVELKGISVGKVKLDLPETMFDRSNNSGGCTMDFESTITLMPKKVYRTLTDTLIKKYLCRYKPLKKHGAVCYFLPKKTLVEDLPSITFHLQNAELVIPPQAAYMFGTSCLRKYFCLAMAGEYTNGLTIIGAMQQANQRFIFDIVKKKLHFGREDCTGDRKAKKQFV